MMLEMMMESTFAVVDIYFVASLGASAVATVGLTESVMTLVYAVAIGLSMGVTALVARRIGEKNPEEAARTAVQAITVGLLTSIPISLAGLFFARDILRLMGGDPWTIENGYRYTVWMLGGNLVIMLLFIINAIFRGAGDAASAMRVLIVANVLNMMLDPLLIFGWGPVPALGIEGAAVATTIGRGVGVIMQVTILLKGARHIRVRLDQLRFEADIMWRLVMTSLGGIGQFIIATSSWIGLVRIMSEFGSTALAGYTIAVRIFIFTIMPAWGLCNAAATLVGQNLGAQQPDRAEKSVWITGRYVMVFMVVVSLVYFFLSQQLMGIFTADPKIIAAGADCIRVVAIGYLFYGWGMVMIQAFNGAGDTVTPTVLNLIFFWLLEIPVAWLLAFPLGLREQGVYWSIVVAESLLALVSIWLFRQGKWKTRVV